MRGCASAGCDLCQQAAPQVIEQALNGMLIHRERLNDAHLDALTHCCPTRCTDRLRRGAIR